jgi:pimeloyl-ACP methyl ester carboxylesterase
VGSLTYIQRIFVFAEETAADFVNNYLSSYPHHLAGVCVSGDALSVSTAGKLPIPAYLYNAKSPVIDFYKQINLTDATKTKGKDTVFYSKANDVQQVVVSKEKKLNYKTVSDMWMTLGQMTARMCINDKIYANRYASDPFILTKLPVYQELNITRIDHVSGILPGAAELVEWYEYIPNEILNKTGTQTYPLILVMHGSGDHPVFEAESQGWVTLAGEERLIVVSLRHQTLNVATMAEDVNKLLDYIIAKYPVDTTRVFTAGFSMGGPVESRVVSLHMERYTGMAILHSQYNPTEASFDNPLPHKFGEYYQVIKNNKDALDLAVYYSTGSRETSSAGSIELSAVGIQNTLLNLAYLNDINISFPEHTPTYQNFFGTGGSADFSNKIDGMMFYSKQLKNADGVSLMQLNYLEGADHVHFTGNARSAWNFLQHFSREADGRLKYE